MSTATDIFDLLTVIGKPYEVTLFLFKEDLGVYKSEGEKTKFLPSIESYVRLMKDFYQKIDDLQYALNEKAELSLSETIRIAVESGRQKEFVDLVRESEEKIILSINNIIGGQKKRVEELIKEGGKMLASSK